MVVNALCNFFNLPLSNWYPGNVPDPTTPVILIDCNGKTDEEVLRDSVLHTYNIYDDNIRLRSSPADFEKQRGDYPVRREFSAYTVILKGGTKSTRMILKGLGFKVG
jgi:erythronate-4-phosphate dehydrogenase